MRKKFKIKKIPLQGFLVLLNEMWENGADFVDLTGFIDEEKKQDEITVHVPLEYMNGLEFINKMNEEEEKGNDNDDIENIIKNA